MPTKEEPIFELPGTLKKLVRAAETGDVAYFEQCSFIATPIYREILKDNDIWLLAAEDGDLTSNPTQSGDRPVHRAARCGHLNVVQYLVNVLDEPFDILLNNRGGLAVHIAAQQGHLNIVRFFASKNPFAVEARDVSGSSPLTTAAYFGHFDVVAFLVEETKADLNVRLTDSNSLAIHLACANGHFKVAKYLLEQGEDFLEARDSDGDTPLNRAAAKGHIEIVRYLVNERHANVENRGFAGRTPLLQAVVGESLECTRFLVEEASANLHAVDVANKDSALHLACYFNKSIDIAKYLASIEPSMVTLFNEENLTPLCKAVTGSRLNIVRFLVDEVKVDVEAKTLNDDVTAVMYACQLGFLDVATFLAERGANVKAKTANRLLQPVHFAAYSGHLPIVRFLFDRFPEFSASFLDDRLNDDDKLIHLACRGGSYEVVNFLLGLDRKQLEQPGRDRRTPLIAATQRDQVHICRLLVLHGANLWSRWEAASGALAIHIAVSMGHSKTAGFLLGICPNLLEAETLRGDSPLHVAAWYGQNKIVEWLVRKKRCDVEHRNSDGRTALLVAAKQANLRAVKILVEQGGADIYSEDSSENGCLAIHLAAYKGNYEIIEYLLFRDANMANVANRGGWTPLILAMLGGNDLVRELLLENGAAVHRSILAVGHFNELRNPRSKYEHFPALKLRSN